MKTRPFFSTSFAWLTFIIVISMITGCAQTNPERSLRGARAASHPDQQAVRQVIDDLFDAMRAGDGDKVASLFADEVTMQRAGTDRDGKPQLGNTPVSRFAEAVNKPHEQVWDERIWNVEVKVDNRLASAWMNFAFYLGDQFSHCGVNSFQLFNGDDGWKIIYLADTSQREGCEIPEYVESGEK